MWTDQKIELTRQMWGEGYSTSQIASHVGKSRNAVIGKIHRMGLQKMTRTEAIAANSHRERARAARERVRTAAKDRPKPPPAVKPALSKAVKPAKPGGIPLEALTGTTCRWPITDNTPHMFCGRKAEGRYCVEHTELGKSKGRGHEEG
jgi:hypothetical protein